MNSRSKSAVRGYSVAVLLTVAAIFVRELADPYLADKLPLPPFFIAVALTAALFGRGPGLAAMLLGGLAADYLFIAPRGSFAITDLPGAVCLSFYFGMSFAVIGAMEIFARTQDSLRRSEARFRAIADAAPILMWTAGSDGSCEYFNKSWVDFTGRTLEQEQGHGWETGIHPDDHELLIGTYRCAVDARIPFSVEYRRLRADGEYRWILANGAPRFDEDRKFTGFVGTGVDITDRKATELAMRTNEERFRVAVDAGCVGVWDWNIPLDQITWSDHIYSIHGISRETFGGKLSDLEKLIHPKDLPVLQQAIRQAIEERADYKDIEFRIIRPSGEERVLVTSGRVIYDEAGAPLRMVGAVVDVTNRKLAEAALRRSEKLAAAGRLAASIAHEINNPLEAVTNLLYLARLENSWSNVQNILEAADHELQRVGQITRQSLGFYRECTKPQRFSVAEAVESVLFLYERRLQTRSVRVLKELDLDVEVEAVAGEVKQVISNLLLNAADVLPPEGRLRLRVHRTQHWARLLVGDSGPGVDSEIRARIFEPFTTSKKDVGTGLGLWVSRQIAQKHGGTLRFRSCNGRANSGTVFVLSLPLAQPMVGRPPRPTSTANVHALERATAAVAGGGLDGAA